MTGGDTSPSLQIQTAEMEHDPKKQGPIESLKDDHNTDHLWGTRMMDQMQGKMIQDSRRLLPDQETCML
ncbi:hypothetical protein Pcinc_033757 [Petrolisthes cinctipes]|uniref:Uncharacterized protein n=1 Tax=Petrolisthes cinctipes TaxID=88211 RepID=A0AAE1ERJ4_PETCI|nr:hypothetical protein Pcinc_033757 [Petrolisthes cinctipes]